MTARRVPGAGPLPATSRVMIVGEAPGADEEARGVPFIGKSGTLLDSMLAQAGLGRSGCYVTNVCKYRPPANKIEEWWTPKSTVARKNGLTHRHGDHWLHPRVVEGLAELPGEIAAAAPEVIIALGNLALWALTGETGIGNWRGSEMWYAGTPAPLQWDWSFKAAKGAPPQAVSSARTGSPAAPVAVVPTYHPAYVLRVWEWKAAVQHDLKVRVFGKMGKDRGEPEYRFFVPDSPNSAAEALCSLISRMRETRGDLVCDIETRRGRLVCAGFGWSDLDAICVPFMHVDGRRFWYPEHEERLAGLCAHLLAQAEGWAVGNQNWNYDRQYFVADPAFGFRPRIDFDTMIAQHLLLPGTPKDLSYLSSLYCKHHRFWKEEGKEIMGEVDEDRFFNYNCLDAVKTWEVWQAQKRLLAQAGFL